MQNAQNKFKPNQLKCKSPTHREPRNKGNAIIPAQEI
jgi:hypothetical protein